MRRSIYIPVNRVTQTKVAEQDQFEVKTTGKPYESFYIEDSQGQYYATGLSEQIGEELLKVGNTETDLRKKPPLSFSQLIGTFVPFLKKGDLKRGISKRYFIKDKVTGKIVEIDLQTFQQAKRLPSKILAEVDWNIKAPAEDMMINGYTLEGSASKNKKLIQALEKIMPGISNFVTDYSLLIQPLQPKPEVTQTVVVSDSPEVDLENSRKANFDKKE